MASEGRSTMARRIFDEALTRPASERSAYLSAAFQGDPLMAQEVKQLIESSGLAKSFFSEETHDSPRIDRYVILRELGRGGMGVVYEAVDPQIGRHLAIKVINLQALATPEEAAGLRDRLFREARSAGALSHPGIVVVYDVGEDNQKAYIAMECVEGPSLQQLMASEKRLDSALAVDLLRQTAAALDYAHQRGIVHRDIKPANILLHQGRIAKIADFGIARISFEPKYTMTGVVMGTPDYMSPEQIEAQPVDGRADQFSLAVMAYEILTGATPFHGGSYASIVHRIVAGPRPSAHASNPLLPSAVDAVLTRAMEPQPLQRFATCGEFVGALEDAMRSAAAAPAAPAAETVAFLAPAPTPVPTVASTAPVPAPIPAPVPPPVAHQSTSPIGYILAGVAALVLVLAGAAYYFLIFARNRAVPPARPPQAQVAASSQPANPPAEPAVPTPAPTLGTSSGKAASSPPKSTAAQTSPNRVPAPPPDPMRDLRQAAESGDAAAMDKLGQSYERGDGVPQDSSEAFRWYRKAADADQASAQYHLGTLYEAGIGTARNFNQATRLYRQAAAGGSPEAQARLAQLQGASSRPAPKVPPAAASPSPATVSIRVPANVPWTDTGIVLRAGDSVTVTASGTVSVTADGLIPPKAPGGFSPDCAAAASFYRGAFGGFPAPRLPCWSLIGRVGRNGKIFEVGAKTTFQAQSNGKLLLGVNDDSMENNSGYWTVSVMVQRVE